MSYSRALPASRSVCSFGIGTARCLARSATDAYTGAACANSGNTTSRTGRNGALPATAESIIDSIRVVLAAMSDLVAGLGRSVWQAAAAYRMGVIGVFIAASKIAGHPPRAPPGGPRARRGFGPGAWPHRVPGRLFAATPAAR